jgi:SAM-dependent methyltransferase
MRAFREKRLAGLEGRPLRILDVGSTDVNGTYREVFDRPGWEYRGADTAPGKNVDIVLPDPNDWSQVPGESFDVVISGQAFEHMPCFWIAALEIARVLKPGGWCCIIAPASGPEHRYPVDCWRFYPDGMRSLAEWARLTPVEVSTQWESEGHADGSDVWKDSLLVCQKPVRGFLGSLKHRVKLGLLRAALHRAAPRAGR